MYAGVANECVLGHAPQPFRVIERAKTSLYPALTQTLLSLVHALYEGNPQLVSRNTEKLNDAVEELRQLLNNHHDLKVVETPIYGYVWLNMETAHQLELLSNLICRALRK